MEEFDRNDIVNAPEEPFQKTQSNAMTKEQFDQFRYLDMQKHLYEEQIKKDQIEQEKIKRQNVMYEVFGSKIVLATGIFCWVNFALTCLSFLLSVILSMGSSASEVVGAIIGNIFPLTIYGLFGSGCLGIYRYGQEKSSYSIHKLTKGLKNLKDGLTFYQVILSLVLALVVLMLIFMISASGIFTEILDEIAGSNVVLGGATNAILVIIFAFILLIFILATLFISGCKKVIKDANNKVLNIPSATPKILPIAIILLIVGTLMCLLTLGAQISSSLQGNDYAVLSDDTVRMAENGLHLISNIIGYILGVLNAVPFLLGAIALLQYRSATNRLYPLGINSPNL